MSDKISLIDRFKYGITYGAITCIILGAFQLLLFIKSREVVGSQPGFNLLTTSDFMFVGSGAFVVGFIINPKMIVGLLTSLRGTDK